MRNWKRVLNSNGDTLSEASIQRGIFQGDSLSPLLFIIILMLLSMTLNNTNYAYLLSKGIPINYILFMDDLKFCDKTAWITIIDRYSLGNFEIYWLGIWNEKMLYCAHKERKNLWYGRYLRWWMDNEWGELKKVAHIISVLSKAVK